jgi:hypothetical protein
VSCWGMLTGSYTCGVCHTGSVVSGVKIGSSDGAGGLAPLGCLGCHGRNESSGIKGSGLRQENTRKGMSCSGCHSDTDPATFPVVGEGALPPYYANPGSFTGIPTHPCNLPAQSNPETRFGSWGLDNNGDGLYDVVEATDDCASVAPVDDSTLGPHQGVVRGRVDSRSVFHDRLEKKPPHPWDFAVLRGVGLRAETYRTVAGDKGVSAAAELAMRELVVRQLISDRRPQGPVFVSFGKTWADAIDPPAGFLERLADVGVVLKPVSEYRKDTDENPVLLIAHVKEWISETEAHILATRFRLGVGGAEGFTAVVEWSGGVWSIRKRIERWAT